VSPPVEWFLFAFCLFLGEGGAKRLRSERCIVFGRTSKNGFFWLLLITVIKKYVEVEKELD
jgi:hypothetical protein